MLICQQRASEGLLADKRSANVIGIFLNHNVVVRLGAVFADQQTPGSSLARTSGLANKGIAQSLGVSINRRVSRDLDSSKAGGGPPLAAGADSGRIRYAEPLNEVTPAMPDGRAHGHALPSGTDRRIVAY